MKRKLIENYALCETLGEGSFGKVYKALQTDTDLEFAVKVIPLQKFKENSKLQSCSLNEIKNLTRIQSNPHIIKFIQMLKTPNNFYFVYEYCNQKTLESRLKLETRIPEAQSLRIFGQLLQAFKILNKYNIMHRDLKPDNIFFHNGIVKLGDFGFCKTLLTHDDMTSTMLGSPIYMAPEVLRGEIYTSKADIWSLGVVLYQMLYGFCPFQSNSIAKLIAVLDNQELKFPNTVEVSEATKNILRKLLIKDQFKRIDWFQLLTMNNQSGICIPLSITESLSTKDSEKLRAQLKKYKSLREPTSESGTIKYSHSSKFIKHKQKIGSPTSQKALTFRKKNDQNTKINPQINRQMNVQSIKSPQSTYAPSPRNYQPLQKLQFNIVNPGLQRKPSLNSSSKRRNLLMKHNECLMALRTAIGFQKSDDSNSSIYSFLIFRKIDCQLRRITECISCSEIELQDLMTVISQQIRQIQKQVKILQKSLQIDCFCPNQMILRDLCNERTDVCLWQQMMGFLNK